MNLKKQARTSNMGRKISKNLLYQFPLPPLPCEWPSNAPLRWSVSPLCIWLMNTLQWSNAQVVVGGGKELPCMYDVGHKLRQYTHQLPFRRYRVYHKNQSSVKRKQYAQLGILLDVVLQGRKGGGNIIIFTFSCFQVGSYSFSLSLLSSSLWLISNQQLCSSIHCWKFEATLCLCLSLSLSVSVSLCLCLSVVLHYCSPIQYNFSTTWILSFGFEFKSLILMKEKRACAWKIPDSKEWLSPLINRLVEYCLSKKQLHI